ncbi:MAG TPA: cytochrome c biogenesis protein CcdA [Candidatus Micrarchaeia archaeon]|nr:cytochrome c biogenesis protein CcdA [Candidatus Micrarchaeia archaeon]
MTLDSIPIPLAAAAGAASFLSPCVLPLVPAYLGFLGGSAVDGSGRDRGGAGPGAARVTRTGSGGGLGAPAGAGAAALPGLAVAVADPLPRRLVVLGNAGAFVLGLSLLFILAFYALQTVLDPWRRVLLPVLGGVVVLLGLQYMGVLRMPWLERERRPWLRAPRRRGPLAGFLLGVGFAAGWTPCIGPVLGAVLTSGVAQGTTGRGLVLMVAYAIGLSVPFLVAACLLEVATPTLRALQRLERPVAVVGGALIVAMGLLVITNHVTVLNGWFAAHLPAGLQDPFNL